MTRLVASIESETQDDLRFSSQRWRRSASNVARSTTRKRRGGTKSVRLLCAQALSIWHRQLRTDERWTALPSAVPGDQPTPISKVYVDLYAVPASELPEDEAPAVEQARRLAGASIRPCSRPSVFRLCSPGRSLGQSSLASQVPGNPPSCNGLPGPLPAVP